MLNDGRELQSKAKEAQKTLYDDKEFTEFLEMVRGFGAYSKVRHDKHYTTLYRANASTAKNTNEQALIYGSGLVALKTHNESTLICESGVKTPF